MRPFLKKTTYAGDTRSVPTLPGILLATSAWLFLWFAPWPAWLESNLWLKVGLALATFLLPGAFVYLLARRGESIRLRWITSGFVFSHLLVALLGTAGRLFHFPFPLVKHAFMALGLALLVAGFLVGFWRSGPATRPAAREGLEESGKDGRPGIGLTGLRQFFARYASYWPLGFIAVLAMLMTVQRALTSDDFAYLAHLTNWQGMPRLNFLDVYFGAEKIESTRFWIVSAPFSQALLSDLGDVPGLLLLGGYYEPFLACIAILCFYDLARTAGLSKNAAMTSVALQVLFLALFSADRHPGAPFFQQLSTDKASAAFILAPVFIAYAIEWLGGSKNGSLFLFLLSGASLSLMHPILAAFGVFIVGAMSVFGIQRDNFKTHGLLILLGIAILLPQVGVRLVEHEAQPVIPSNADSLAQARGIESFITRIEHTPFYGFNPRILEMRLPYQERLPLPSPLLAWAWIPVPLLAALLALKGIRNNPLKQYILAATSLVAIAGIPYTGWLLGTFVSAWMLERTTWLYPFGISTVFVLLALRDETRLGRGLMGWPGLPHPARNGWRIWQSARAFAWAPLWGISVLLVLLAMREQGLPDLNRLEGSTRRYQALAAAGQYIDRNAPGPVSVIGSDDLNDFIPTLSWKAKVISFRPEDTAYPYFFTKKERFARLADRQAVVTKTGSPEERMQILQKYDIRYILIETNRVNRLKDLLETYPENFNIFVFGRYSLVEISGSQVSDINVALHPVY